MSEEEIEKLEALARAVDDAEGERNSIQSRFGNCLSYWDAVKKYDEAIMAFEIYTTPSAILSLTAENKRLREKQAKP